jgi:hypothetical protein
VNDENCPPTLVKAGAAVFGNILFGSEYPDHSLCYSPSPYANRRNDENVARELVDGKVLSFDEPVPSTKTTDTEETTINAVPPPKKSLSGGRPAMAAGFPKNFRSGDRPATAAGFRKNPIIGERPATAAGNAKTPRSGDRPATATGCRQKDVSVGDSVNPTINGVRRSKEENLKETMISVAELRDQRRREKEEVAAFNVKAEQTRREVIELRKKLSERFRQAKVDREQRLREEHLARIENEIKFKSKVHVEHKQTLKELEETRRRMSVEDRAKLRQNHRKGEERLKLLSIQEDQALFEERHESSFAGRTARLENSSIRRESFAFRNGDARRIRELFAQREAGRMHEEHESYELKWAGERDADNYQRQMDEKRRDSLAFRNAEAKRIRDFGNQQNSVAQQKETESYELKWAGERDADEYGKLMSQERRDSLAFRNAEAKRIRDLETQMKADEHHKEHESYELKWAGERDADEYGKLMSQERRDSLAFRNADAKRIRDLETQMKADEHHAQHESYELKWAGERDADNYQRQMDEKRRESLNYRNQEAARHTAVMMELLSLAQERERESYMLKWAGENDATQYITEQAELCRQSLAFRNAEGKRHRDIDEETRVKNSNEIAKNEELSAACE